jgi:peptide/nickel transport system permease protein
MRGFRHPPMDPPPGPVDPAWLRKGRPGRRFSERLRQSPSLVLGISILAAFGGVAVLALLEWGTSVGNLAIVPSLGAALPPPGPSSQHPFGVMANWGVGIFTALVRATPIDLALVGGPIALAATVGVLVGTKAGYSGGWVDTTVVGFADVLGSVPSFLLIWVLYFGIAIWIRGGSSLVLFAVLLSVILWPNYAHQVRALTLEVAREDFVESSRASGASSSRIVLRHILPNSLSPVFSQVPFDVYSVFFILTLYPFVACYGVGPNGGLPLLSALPSTAFPEWGSYFANGVCFGWSIIPVLNYWWMYAFPLAAIVLFGVGISLFCDGMGRYFDSRLD